jgi:auxin efflux carrier family protein
MNSNSLPIALMQSLVITVHGLKWGQDDTRDSMLGRALTYLVLHSTFGMMLRWSFGVRLLAQADDEVLPSLEEEVVPPREINAQDRSNSRSKVHEREPLLGSSKRHRDYSSVTIRSQSSTTYTQTDDETGEISQSRPRTPTKGKIPEFRTAIHQVGVPHPITGASAQPAATEPLGLPAPMGGRPSRPPVVNKRSHFFYSFPNTPQLSSTSLAPSQSVLDLPGPTTQSPPETPIGTRIKSKVSSFATRTRKRLAKLGKSVKDFMTPPLYSALFSLVVACIPPLQHLLDVHLTPVKGAISSAGNCSIPITLVVLGGYFWRGDGSEEQTGPNQPRHLRTDLPQQVQTAAPLFVRRKTKLGSRSGAPDTSNGEGNGTLTGRVVTNEPTGMDGDTAGEGMSRPISDATLVGANTSSVTPTWSLAWKSLKSRSRAYAKAHADDDEHTSVHPTGDTESTSPAASNGIPTPATTPAKNLEEHKGEARTVLVAILSRMIITPMILLPIMALVMSKTTMRLFDE